MSFNLDRAVWLMAWCVAVALLVFKSAPQSADPSLAAPQVDEAMRAKLGQLARQAD